MTGGRVLVDQQNSLLMKIRSLGNFAISKMPIHLQKEEMLFQKI
ncbi:MAG: hypothetical protein HLUCCX10_14130 [Algoriphagus marincola HL-49]|uniref:Uncharacterized protein n=1 Tax=Algoriphagus marincola HL-49 TaxID=1305737 RepID=A0A0P7XZ27_9BACT|nr:MAG: hypothetical protein HLUCCX10_14130 [Algoriphagus marincola HL-49]